ncbi:MAG: hypothetical protein ACXVZO_04510 [Gaiellaceae bacterium]
MARPVALFTGQWTDHFALGAHRVGPAVCDRIDSHGATFEDGDRAAEVCDAIVRSSASGQRQELSYRSLGGRS